ncbi:MAG: hypothetical protein ACLVJO_03550 [[Clostridium] scindens]
MEDEIYKTVTFLYQTKEAAVQAKMILRKICPILRIRSRRRLLQSLSLQTMQRDNSNNKVEQIQKQLLRLSHLEEALLVLSALILAR